MPLLARASGLVQVLAGLVGLVAPFLAYLVVGGEEVRLVSGPADVLVVVLLPLASVAAGLILLAGRVPKLGLAYGAVAGTLAVGRLCIELYEGRASTARPGSEVISGQLVTTSTVQAQAGWVLGVAALALTVLAGLLAAAAWGRTVMEDGGSLDPARPALAGTAAALGALTVLCLTLPPVDVPDELVTDPDTGLVTVVTREGSQALLERPGLALLGGLLLAGALLLCSVIAPSLRPRLAAVGGLAAVGLVVLAQGLTGLRDAATSDDVVWTVPGAGLLVLGLLDVLLAVAAWRHRPVPRPDRGPAAVSGAPAPDTR
ncbi:hypothetical protein [Goekera deserti]|uniref:hypothetical protein n=1 Tax=Goekera deserti TaxID=2497753 RepID=UPI001878F98E|nr:hypothetical protein [Goekera deserti]